MAGGEPSHKPHPKPVGHVPAGTKTALAGLAEARAAMHRMVEVIEQDGRFPVDAYRFLQEGLEFTVRRIHGAAASEAPQAGEAASGRPDPRHVDGAQLARGLRDLALARWGKLAKLVLNAWGVTCTRDFGEMVFVLVEHDFLQKTDGDRIEDFEEIFRFSELDEVYALPAAPLDVSDVNYAGGPSEPVPAASGAGA